MMAASLPIQDVGIGSAAQLPSQDLIFGRSPSMVGLRQRVQKVAGTSMPVLIYGESGTGKEVIARLVHDLSTRRAGPFVKGRCVRITDTQTEDERFGDKWISRDVAGGTVFLDEVSELNVSEQSKLLEALRNGQLGSTGASDPAKVAARLICATRFDLQQEIETGKFRPDLFYRMSVFTIDVPPLRERQEDIGILAEHFLELYRLRYERPAEPLSAKLLSRMEKYEWPGNIRQLENLIERYVVLGSEEAILTEVAGQHPTLLRDWVIPETGVVSLKTLTRNAVRELERTIILKMLDRNEWNRKRTAKALKISYRALLYKMRAAGLSDVKPGDAE